MLFVFHGVDRTDSSVTRQRGHEAHAAYHQSRGNPVGGPLLDDDGQPCGTMYVLEADDLAGAQAVVAGDPFIEAGLFETVALHQFRAVDWPDR